MTQRKLYQLNPLQCGRQFTKQRTWSTPHNLQVAQQVGQCFIPGASVSLNTLLGSSTCVSFFQTSALISESSLQICLSESLLCCLTSFPLRLNFLAYSHREDSSESGQFLRFLEAILNCLSFNFKSFPARWNISISRNYYTTYMQLVELFRFLFSSLLLSRNVLVFFPIQKLFNFVSSHVLIAVISLYTISVLSVNM